MFRPWVSIESCTPSFHPNPCPPASEQLPGADDAPPLLEVAAEDDPHREETAGSKDTRGTEVVLYVSTTIGTGMPARKKGDMGKDSHDHCDIIQALYELCQAIEYV